MAIASILDSSSFSITPKLLKQCFLVVTDGLVPFGDQLVSPGSEVRIDRINDKLVDLDEAVGFESAVEFELKRWLHSSKLLQYCRFGF